MRWRVGLTGLLLIVGGMLGMSSQQALSTASPPGPTALPTPSTETSTSATPSESPTSTTVTPATTTTSATTKPYHPPRGNPTSVSITRGGKQVMTPQPISGPVGLKRDSQGNLVTRLNLPVLEPPDDSVGWYHEQGAWPKPGFPGPSVLVAHISHMGAHGPFFSLASVKGQQTGAQQGDLIAVTYSSGDKVVFRVTEVDHPEKVELPGDKIWNKTQKPVLRLITCDPTTPFVDGHYLGNVLVYADQLVVS